MFYCCAGNRNRPLFFQRSRCFPAFSSFRDIFRGFSAFVSISRSYQLLCKFPSLFRVDESIKVELALVWHTSMFRTPLSRTSVAPLSDTPAEDLNEELKAKKNQKRVREEDEDVDPKQDPDGSPQKKLDPRRLEYPDDDVLNKLEEDDGVHEEEPRTQAWVSEDEQEEGECAQDSQKAA